MLLFKKYEGNEDEYPKYDNIEAINVDKVSEIPMDYSGILGVPITFIGQWNPEQFEIIGIDDDVERGSLTSLKPNGCKITSSSPVVNGENKYRRILIRNKALNPDIYENKVDK